MNSTKDTKATNFCKQDDKIQQAKNIPPCCTSAFSSQKELSLASCWGSGKTNIPEVKMMQLCLKKCSWFLLFLAFLAGIAITVIVYL